MIMCRNSIIQKEVLAKKIKVPSLGLYRLMLPDIRYNHDSSDNDKDYDDNDEVYIGKYGQGQRITEQVC